MWCPECGGEYREGFDRCGDCDVSLAESPPRHREVVRTKSDTLRRPGFFLAVFTVSLGSALLGAARSLTEASMTTIKETTVSLAWLPVAGIGIAILLSWAALGLLEPFWKVVSGNGLRASSPKLYASLKRLSDALWTLGLIVLAAACAWALGALLVWVFHDKLF
jgi:hypothetical protein